MEKKMETTTMGLYRVSGLGLGLYRGNGKENGNYYCILGLYWDNGKENGSCRNHRDYIGVIILIEFM